MTPLIFLALLAQTASVDNTRPPPQACGYEIEKKYPHDVQAFTQGLFYTDGFLYESTGAWGSSTIRRVNLNTGKVADASVITDNVFGEGATALNGRIYSLTWKAGKGFIWDQKTLQELGRFTYNGEGWGLASNGYSLIRSNGSAEIAFIDPRSMKSVRTLQVTYQGKPVDRLNELEWVNGRILANVWQSERIAVINADSGSVEEWIDLTGLGKLSGIDDNPDSVLNGIAYDADGDRLFVTGKNWPWLYHVVPDAGCSFKTSTRQKSAVR